MTKVVQLLAGARWLSLGRSVFISWIGYAILLTVIALPDGLETRIRFLGGAVGVMGSSGDVIQAFGAADVAQQVRWASQILDHGWLSTRSYEATWAPGFALIEAAFVAALGPNGPIVMALLALTILAWAGVFAAIKRMVEITFPVYVAAVAPLILLALPFFRDYFLRDGILSTESLSAAFWWIGFSLLLIGILDCRKRAPIAVGILFATAAFVRAQVDLMLLVGSAIVVIDALLMAFYRWRREDKGYLQALKNVCSKSPTKEILMAIFVSQLVLLPYRVSKIVRLGTPMFTASDYYYKYHWTPPLEYPQAADFILLGGGPVACEVDPKFCESMRQLRLLQGKDVYDWAFYKRMAVFAFLAHPAKWIVYRTAYLGPYWFSEPTSVRPKGRDGWSGFLLLAALLSSVALLIRILRTDAGKALLFGALVIYFGQVVIFIFIHYEVRYLYLLQVSAPLFCIASLVASRCERSVRPD